jgi:hypothetical protein
VKRFSAWLIAGALSGALLVLFMLLMHQHAGLRHYPAPMLEGRSGLKFVLEQAAWGAAYGLVFFAVCQHFLSAAWLPSSLVFAVLPFLTTVFFVPMYLDHPVNGDPLQVGYQALNSAFLSLVLVGLGRQFEK